MKPRTPKPYAAIRRRCNELDMPMYELAERLDMPPSTLSGKMVGRQPWTEPEMQRLLNTIGTPDQTLADYYPRRAT